MFLKQLSPAREAFRRFKYDLLARKHGTAAAIICGMADSLALQFTLSGAYALAFRELSFPMAIFMSFATVSAAMPVLLKRQDKRMHRLQDVYDPYIEPKPDSVEAILAYKDDYARAESIRPVDYQAGFIFATCASCIVPFFFNSFTSGSTVASHTGDSAKQVVVADVDRGALTTERTIKLNETFSLRPDNKVILRASLSNSR